MTDLSPNEQLLICFQARKRWATWDYQQLVTHRVRLASIICRVTDPVLHTAGVKLEEAFRQHTAVFELRQAPGRLWFEYHNRYAKYNDLRQAHFRAQVERVLRVAKRAGEREVIASLTELLDTVGHTADEDTIRQILALASSEDVAPVQVDEAELMRQILALAESVDTRPLSPTLADELFGDVPALKRMERSAKDWVGVLDYSL